MRCLIWAAVSSPGQASEEKDSIPSQIEAGRELVQRREGWYEVHEPLIIGGHSRSYIFLADAAADMPVYTELMSLARMGSIDLLLCRGRDRLGRTDALIAQVEEYLASYNVQILSLSMPTTVQEPEQFAQQRDRAAIWMRSVERARAQDEVAELRARHRMGMRKRIMRGLHASRVPYGYMYYACTHCADENGIHRNTVRDDVAHQALIDWLTARAVNPELLAEEVQRLRDNHFEDKEDDIRSLSSIVGQRKAALDRYKVDYEEGYLDRADYYANKLRLEDELASAESRLLDLQRQRDAFDRERLEQALEAFPAETLAQLRDNWQRPEVARPLKALVRQLGIRVECASSSLSIALHR